MIRMVNILGDNTKKQYPVAALGASLLDFLRSLFHVDDVKFKVDVGIHKRYVDVVILVCFKLYGGSLYWHTRTPIMEDTDSFLKKVYGENLLPAIHHFLDTVDTHCDCEDHQQNPSSEGCAKFFKMKDHYFVMKVLEERGEKKYGYYEHFR